MFFSFLSFFIYFISGLAVIGFLAVAMTLPNIYILSVTFAFFLCFWFHNSEANKKRKRKKVGLIAQLVEHCIGITQVNASNQAVQAELSFFHT